jgi:hypothetical protein
VVAEDEEALRLQPGDDVARQALAGVNANPY